MREGGGGLGCAIQFTIKHGCMIMIRNEYIEKSLISLFISEI